MASGAPGCRWNSRGSRKRAGGHELAWPGAAQRVLRMVTETAKLVGTPPVLAAVTSTLEISTDGGAAAALGGLGTGTTGAAAGGGTARATPAMLATPRGLA